MLSTDRRGYGERPSDELVDGLLGELVLERREVESAWDYASVLKTLKEPAEHVGMYGFEGICGAAIGLLDEWDNPSSAVVDLT